MRSKLSIKIKSISTLPLKSVFGYIFLALVLSAFIAFSPIWGIWLAISLLMALWTKDSDRRFVAAILVLMIFGPIGRFLSPGTIVGSLWAFDPLIGFGLLLRINRFLPIRIKRDAINRISTPWFFVIFSLIGLLGSLFVFPLPVVLKGALYTVRWLGYYLVIKGIGGRIGIKGVLLGIAGILAILGFLQLWLLPAISKEFVHNFAFDPHIGRLFSTWFDPNYLGGFLVVAMLLGLEEKGRMGRKGLKGILIGIIGVAIVLTFSRSSYLALVVGLLVFFGYRSPKVILLQDSEYLAACCEDERYKSSLEERATKRKKIPHSLLRGILLIIALTLAITLLVAPVRERIIGAFTFDITAKQRLSSWQIAWDTVKVNPTIGVGYNLYDAAVQRSGHYFLKADMPYQPAAGGSDSSLLTIWATAGIGGLVVYLLLIWKIWYFGSISKKSAIAAMFVHSLFVNSLLLPPMMIVFWLLLRNDEC